MKRTCKPALRDAVILIRGQILRWFQKKAMGKTLYSGGKNSVFHTLFRLDK
jgi:hypothetical protein